VPPLAVNQAIADAALLCGEAAARRTPTKRPAHRERASAASVGPNAR
jgi:hypothetical protein